MVVLIALTLFGARDVMFQESGLRALLLIKALQFAVALAVLVVLRRSPVVSFAVPFAFAGGTLLAVLTAWAAILRGDVTAPPILYVIYIMGAAVLLPWGARVQAVFSIAGALVVLGDAYVVQHDFGALWSPAGIGVLFAGVASVYIADQFLKYRQAVEESKVAAEAANRAKSLFLSSMSHEIRTPMNAVIGMTDLVLETQLSAAQRADLEIVRTSASALLDVIDDILDFSKIEAGKLDIRIEPFNLRTLLETTVQSLALRAREKGLALTLDVDPRLPSAVSGDPGRIRQVLVNLVNNAIKFTERGSVAVQVAVAPANDSEPTREARQDEPPKDMNIEIHFSVRDTGVGIPPADQQRIFQPFEQASHSSPRRGTGLGLSISTHLVRLMGGRLWVESVVGKGSVFHFTVRCGFGADICAALADVTPMRAGSAPSPYVKGLRVLVAEDNQVNQRLVTRLLQRHDHHVVAVGNGRAALEVLEDEPFDVLLLDVEMPEMGGIETALEIRRHERQLQRAGGSARRLPIVALTAHAMQGDAERCLAAGMDAYVSKPLDARRLFEAIAQVVQSASNDMPPRASIAS